MVPDLEHFIYSSGYNPLVPVVQGCLQPLTQFKRLKSLTTPPAMLFDQNMLQVVSSIATLEKLHCHINLSGISTLVLPSNPFLQLAEADLIAHSDHLITFFRACPFPNLARIELHIAGPPSANHPRDLFIALCQHCDPTLIEHIYISVLHALTPRPSSLMDYAEPLMALRNMRSFHIYFRATDPSLCDDDILRIGAAWPRLASLRIAHVTGEYSQPDVAAPSLSAIVELARRCPALTSLRLPELDSRDLPVPRQSAVSPLGHGLRYLKIDSVRPPPPTSESHQVYMDMATVLDLVFPSIDLKKALSKVDPRRKSWADILLLMQAKQAERANGPAMRADLQREA
ncbi:hypothetical protein GSI_05584 [Ganoderma sinense ZZ0214-1]|uniref:Uncharacterized protein n=1 Tax=Ganoderma sinense ZZ0214-1 TaxID=1077348 RepID=A0A2G8SFG8_9APHY|nr:hypothetical protein GSI_05584 [Ganoderma sinense ZZ0214-1]